MFDNFLGLASKQEVVLIRLATVCRLPKVQGSQRQGYTCADAEGLSKFVIEVRAVKPLDEVGVGIHRGELFLTPF